MYREKSQPLLFLEALRTLVQRIFYKYKNRKNVSTVFSAGNQLNWDKSIIVWSLDKVLDMVVVDRSNYINKILNDTTKFKKFRGIKVEDQPSNFLKMIKLFVEGLPQSFFRVSQKHSNLMYFFFLFCEQSILPRTFLIFS